MYQFFKFSNHPSQAFKTVNGVPYNYHNITYAHPVKFGDMEVGDVVVVGSKFVQSNNGLGEINYGYVPSPTTTSMSGASSRISSGGLLQYGISYGEEFLAEFVITKTSETQVRIETYINNLLYSQDNRSVSSAYQTYHIAIGNRSGVDSKFAGSRETYATSDAALRLGNWNIADTAFVIDENQPITSQEMKNGFSTEDPIIVDYRLDVSALPDNAQVVGTIHDHSTRLRRRSLRSATGSHQLIGKEINFKRDLELVAADYTSYFRYEDTDPYPEGITKAQLENTVFRVAFDETHEE